MEYCTYWRNFVITYKNIKQADEFISLCDEYENYEKQLKIKPPAITLSFHRRDDGWAGPHSAF